jgi:putative ABC transport system permease protein
MRWWRSRRPQGEQIRSELHFHIEELTEAYVRGGMAPDEARRRALVEFGGREQIEEECHDVHRIATVENTIANLKHSLRFIRKSPSFSLTVIVTLALAIGANTAVFSAVDAILLRPLPFPDSEQLVQFHEMDRTTKVEESRVSTVRIEDWNRLNSTFHAISGYYAEDTTETSTALPEKVNLAYVMPRFFQVWGVAPILGRDFTQQEWHFGGAAAMVMSDRFWRRMFQADPHVVGRRLRIGGYFFTGVGVMPASFLFPDRNVEAWASCPIDAPYAQNRASTWFIVVGRMKPGVSIETAHANITAVQAELGLQFPKTDKSIAVGLESLKENTIGGARRSLSILFGSVSLLLLIACTNIAALLLARTTQREREMTIRYSLGASRASVITQLLTESFVLALIGSTIGLVLAAAASNVFRSQAKSLPRVDEIAIDWRILLYSLVCAVAATLLFGLAPAWQGSRRSVAGRLARNSRTQVSAADHSTVGISWRADRAGGDAADWCRFAPPDLSGTRARFARFRCRASALIPYQR